jgi:hypothetical protein
MRPVVTRAIDKELEEWRQFSLSALAIETTLQTERRFEAIYASHTSELIPSSVISRRRKSVLAATLCCIRAASSDACKTVWRKRRLLT